MPFSLNRHPSTPNSPIRSIEAHAAIERQALRLEYFLEGDIGALDLPPPASPSPTDRLWQNTCCEAFLQAPAISAGYYEFNFSPSSAWAAYRFEAYRQGMAAVGLNPPPAIQLRREGQSLVLAATVKLEVLRSATDLFGPRIRAVELSADGAQGWICASYPPPASPAFNPLAAWRLGLSAVIKDRLGGVSYWALAHPGGKPDFHHADSFILTL